MNKINFKRLCILLIFILMLVGCKENYCYVTFDIDGEKTIIKVENNTCVSKIDDPNKDGYVFKGWYLDDIKYDFNTKVVNDITLVAKFEKQEEVYYHVIFKDSDGKVLKEENVKENESAIAPTTSTKDGYVFKGWDKEYNNVQSDLEIIALYEIDIDKEYNITFDLGNGTWNSLNKNEFIKLFLIDFYNFVKPIESKQEFIYGDDLTFTGSWKNYIGGYFNGKNKLIKDNGLEDDNSYFLNSYEYKNKWLLLANWVKNLNNRFANGDENQYYGGSLDFYRYCISDASGYDSVYGDNFNLYPTDINVINTYKVSNVDIILSVPLREDFDGWYEDSSFKNKISVIDVNTIGDRIFYAKWNDTSIGTYEVSFNVNGGIDIDNITVDEGNSIILPRATKGGYIFESWTLDGKTYNKGEEYMPTSSVIFKANWKENLTNLSYSGTNVTYRNSTTIVQIPNLYESKVSEFRAAWVSCYVGDYKASIDKNTMIANLTEVLDVLQSFNMNAIVFHIRITNDACYNTDLAPIRSGFGDINTFEKWDYLSWFIEECHNRGIQFHAWLNPYRIKASGFSENVTVEEVASLYEEYPKNPASNKENILITYRSDGTHGAILNPCKIEVQDYIVDVCLDIMKHYDIDAIHFDDYFYAQLSSNNSVLNEADQEDYEAYIDNNANCGYSKTSSSDKKNWRRENVNSLIYKLHVAMSEFNELNKRGVQLGIAPTGIYRNGNGTVSFDSTGIITSSSGSNTAGQEHYASYLYCDTVKWVRNEWIDYICPQTYWAFTHSVAGYADVVDWWVKVVSGTNVNLYTGMGIYMSTDYTSSKSWCSEEYEASNQVLYNTKYNNIKGTCIYVYNRIKKILNDDILIAHKGLMKIKNEYWTEYVSPPLTMADKYKE